MRTPEEIENLKADWLQDPCWPIECTDGYDGHEEELKAWRLKVEAIWEEEYLKKQSQEMARMGIFDTAIYTAFKNMQFQIDQLKEQIKRLELK